MADSRFNLDSFIAGADKAFIQANIKTLKQLSTGVYVVPPMHAHRLDLISFTIYGTVAMKPYLIYVNDIVDLSMIKHGFKMLYPTINDILSIMNETADFIK
jgi:hypothetical protein